MQAWRVVTPRPYTLRRRKQTTDATRERIVAAARALLATSNGARAMTIDAVAREAGVTRATVYQQIGSKPLLLSAVLDDLAHDAGLHTLPAVIMQAEPVAALDEFIAVVVRFWASDRTLHRHLSALSDMDPQLRELIHERRSRRAKAMVLLAQRLDPTLMRAPKRLAESVDVLLALTGPAMLDTLASEGRTPAQIIAIVQRLARVAIPPASTP